MTHRSQAQLVIQGSVGERLAARSGVNAQVGGFGEEHGLIIRQTDDLPSTPHDLGF